MTNFESLGLSPKALKAVSVLGYDQPTPVQEKTIPLVLEGRDVIAGAQTGTGKTAAFCLPCMDKLGHAGKHCGPLMLVVTPTRELADQIGAVCDQIARVTKHKVTTVVGGVSYNPQREALKRGTDVLIATPGRLEDLMAQEAAGLDQVRMVVIDEADRMLDMGFLPAVQRIVDACTAREQTLLFSATIDDAVQKVAKKMLHEPASVEVAKRGETADTVDQYLVRISHAAKPSAMKAILKERGAERVIVFARTRHRADSCCRRINRMGYLAEAIHSDKSQNQRRRSLEGFAKGKVKVLVATDVLARGIDVEQVDYVVNYDMPAQPEDYIHRIGRTGRAGERGYAISLVSPENEEQLKEVEALIKKEIPEITLQDFDVEAVEADAQVRSMQLQARRTHDPEVAAAVKDMNAARKKKAKAKAAAEEAAAKKRGGSGKGKGAKTEVKAAIKPEVLTPEQIEALEQAAREVSSRRDRVDRSDRGSDSPARGAGRPARDRCERPARKGASSPKKGPKGAAASGRGKAAGASSGKASAAGRSKASTAGRGKAAAAARVKAAAGKAPVGKASAGRAPEGRASAGKASAGHKDFRPGRAHRAEVSRGRGRS